MQFCKDTRILIVGLGLMGGSCAAALTDAGYEVGAVDPNGRSIAYAKEAGIIRHGNTEVQPEYLARFDLVLFALYPHVLLQWVQDNQLYLREGALLMDVTGVKGSVVYPVQAMLRPGLEFVGAHPMAGREVSGVENAKRDLFHGANFIVTPTERNTSTAVSVCMEVGRLLGCTTLSQLSPEKHDEMIAFLSQLTHCIAIALMDCRETEHMARYTGDSFRDLTRIARINDAMWSELFAMNKEQLLRQMDLFSAAFADLRQAIAADDTAKVRDMMRLSTCRRAYYEKI